MADQSLLRNRKKYRVLLTAAIVLVVAVLDIFLLVLPDRQLSDTENRNLQQFPRMTWQTITQGRFESQFEDYIADQFPGRDVWVGAATTAERLAGNTLSNDIFLGKDGYLIQRFQAPSEEKYQEIRENLTQIARDHAEVQVYALVAPTAVSVLKDLLPAFSYDQISGDEDAFLNHLYEDLTAAGIHTVDVRPELADLWQQGQQVYYRTDHHWTTDAAYRAFQKWAAIAGTEASGVTWEKLLVSDSFQGTLSASSGFRTNETDELYVWLMQPEAREEGQCLDYFMTNLDTGEKRTSLYDTAYLNTRDQYGLFLGGNHGELKIRTSAGAARNLLVLKDSYANCFIPFLVPDFPNIIVVDPRYYLGDLDQLIRDEQITDILFLYNAQTLAS